MIHTIAQVLKINTEQDLLQQLVQLDEQYEEDMVPLTNALAKNVFSMDPHSLSAHAGLVDSWRDKISRFLMIASALVEHAKSDRFELPAQKGNTEIKRDMHRRSLSGGFDAWKTRLDHTIRSIDNRVNLCKKLLGIESSVESVRSYSRVA